MFSCLHKLPKTASHPLCRLSSRTQHDGGCNKEKSEANGNQEITFKPLHPVGSHLRSSGSSGQGFPQYCSLRRTIFFLLENLSSQEQVELQLPHSPSLQSTEKQRAFYSELSINRTSSTWTRFFVAFIFLLRLCWTWTPSVSLRLYDFSASHRNSVIIASL